MRLSPFSSTAFFAALLSLCCLYLGIECFINAHTMFSVDEFWFAHRAYQYKSGLPYKDFAPYKTVLGYYFLLLPMLPHQAIIATLINMKNALALLNTLVFFLSSYWLSRFFSRAGVLFSLVLLVSTEIVLSYSTNIRVDLLGYWCCLFALLLLLDKRFWLAGVLLGLGFVTSQKSIWYALAFNVALGSYDLLLERRVNVIGDLVKLNVAALAVALLYLILWSWVADPLTVLHSVFYEASAMYQLDWYASSRTLFWTIITLYNPLLFFLWPLTFMSLVVTYAEDKSYRQRFLVTVAGLVILFCLLPYQQVFPYYMQVVIPILLVVYAAFFTWLLGLHQCTSPVKVMGIGKKGLWLGLGVYVMGISGLIVTWQLPLAYLFMGVLAIMLGLYCTRPNQRTLMFPLLGIVFLVMGGLYPLSLFGFKVAALNGDYQKAHIRALPALLADGSDYVAGIELLYNKNQPIAGLRHLMGPAIDYLYSPSEKIRPVMLASLYEDPHATIASVIHDLQLSSVKLVVNNYRMDALPPAIKAYLHATYAHFWGSIYLYAPEVRADKQSLDLKFSGVYLIETASPQTIQLNSKPYRSNTLVTLKKGSYVSQAPATYRLKLIPPAAELPLEPDYWQDKPEKIIF